MSDDPISMLERAVALVRAKGHPCEGYTLQSAADGTYVAWLYAEDEGQQWSLFEDVEVCETALEAARWVLQHAEE
jgi:hypothetical protein